MGVEGAKGEDEEPKEGRGEGGEGKREREHYLNGTRELNIKFYWHVEGFTFFFSSCLVRLRRTRRFIENGEGSGVTFLLTSFFSDKKKEKRDVVY